MKMEDGLVPDVNELVRPVPQKWNEQMQTLLARVEFMRQEYQKAALAAFNAAAAFAGVPEADWPNYELGQVDGTLVLLPKGVVLGGDEGIEVGKLSEDPDDGNA
jgi:hypothetical protein